VKTLPNFKIFCPEVFLMSVSLSLTAENISNRSRMLFTHWPVCLVKTQCRLPQEKLSSKASKAKVLDNLLYHNRFFYPAKQAVTDTTEKSQHTTKVFNTCLQQQWFWRQRKVKRLMGGRRMHTSSATNTALRLNYCLAWSKL